MVTPMIFKIPQKTLAFDLKAGLVVFLIALPLSVGISLASGAPASSGLISAILGGLLGSWLGGSFVTINGPAAGLIVVVLNAITQLGQGDASLGFKRMLAVIVVVGVLQILSGILKFGRFISLFPLSVIHGMLFSIGLIIMVKQVHVFLGQKVAGDILHSIALIPHSLTHMNPESALIGLFSLLTLIVFPKIKSKIFQTIPAPLVVVVFGIILTYFLPNVDLVKIPTKIGEFFTAPLFHQMGETNFIIAVVSVYFVASLESVLSASAVDQLDPLKRTSNFNRELWSKGVVNLACGFLGGLPIIAEIVRSSANITQGAKTPWSNFFHSFFLLVFVVALPSTLNHIPLSSLAAILLLVGFRLAHPRQIKEMKELGLSSLLSFAVTIVVTVAEDLLVGIAAGMLVKFLLSLTMGAKISQLFKPQYQVSKKGDSAILKFNGSLNFFSTLEQKSIFSIVESYHVIEVDLTDINYIDATSMSLIARERERLIRTGHVVKIKLADRFKALMEHIEKH